MMHVCVQIQTLTEAPMQMLMHEASVPMLGTHTQTNKQPTKHQMHERT
jgi:hypothetical protein